MQAIKYPREGTHPLHLSLGFFREDTHPLLLSFGYSRESAHPLYFSSGSALMLYLECLGRFGLGVCYHYLSFFICLYRQCTASCFSVQTNSCYFLTTSIDCCFCQFSSLFFFRLTVKQCPYGHGSI